MQTDFGRKRFLALALASTALATSLASGDTRWVRVLEPAGYGPTIGSDGEDIVVMDWLRKYNADGELLWDRANGLTGQQVVRPTGEFYGTRYVGEPPRDQHQLLRFDRDGLNPELIGSAAADCCSISVFADAEVNRVFTRSNPFYATFEYRGADGTQWAFQPGFRFYGSAKLDPFGNVVIEGNLDQPTTIRGRDLSAGFTLFKFSRAGDLLWTRQLPGRVDSRMDFSAIGTVVLVVSTDTPFTWAGESFVPDASGSKYLVVAEGVDGDQRFARHLADGPSTPWWDFTIAVDPRGQAAISTSLVSTATVFKYNLAGEFLWQRDFSSDGGAVSVRSLAISRDNVIASGAFSGTVDFGLGPEQSDVRRAFLVNLGP